MSQNHEFTAQGGAAPIPRVSVGMPVFNGERYLPAALDSLLGQSFGDFELIISDNASTDDTQTIIRQYAARDSRIRYERQSVNQGAAWNFNRVVHLAQSSYFKWAAADDLCDRRFLAQCVAVLDQDPTIVCCHARTRKIDETGAVLPGLHDPTDGGLPSEWFLGTDRPRRHRPDASLPIPHLRFRDVLLSSGWAVRCSGVIRTEMLRQTCLIPPHYGSEKVTMAELALRGRFHDLPETLFFQRVHAEASSRLNSAAAQNQFVTSQRKVSRGSLRLQLLRGHLRAVSRAPIDSYQRWRCRMWITRYLLQTHKWPCIIRSMLLGRGVGDSSRSSHGAILPRSNTGKAVSAPISDRR